MSFDFTTNYPLNGPISMMGDPGYDYSRLFVPPSLFPNTGAAPMNSFSRASAGAAEAYGGAKQFFSPSPVSAANKSTQPEPSTTVKTLGTLTAIFGGINAAVGQFYAAKTQQYEMQSQASALQFQSGMDAINAHGAEMNAQSILEASKTQVQQYTMRAGQEQAASTVATAARGVDLSSQSAIDQRASNDLVKQIDVMTINANATRAAWAQRTQATNDSNASLLTRVSANNMQMSADTISPGDAFMTSLLGSATSLASKWDWRRTLAAGVSPG